MPYLFTDGFLDARIFLDADEVGYWRLEISKDGVLLDDLAGFPALSAAVSCLMLRHPDMVEVGHE